MGISISVLMATDAQIRDFRAQPSGLENLLNRTIPYSTEDKCYLADCWHGLHYLLTGEVKGGELPLCALRWGEVTFTGLSDPTHAIYRDTANAFARELSKLSESTLWERFDPNKVPIAGRRGRPIIVPALAKHIFPELLSYFFRLQKFSIRAAEKDMGLLFCRYEGY